MTPEEFKERMQDITDVFNDPNRDYFHDIEGAHRAMDRLMCEALYELGYGEGVAMFEAAPKWYA